MDGNIHDKAERTLKPKSTQGTAHEIAACNLAFLCTVMKVNILMTCQKLLIVLKSTDISKVGGQLVVCCPESMISNPRNHWAKFRT